MVALIAKDSRFGAYKGVAWEWFQAATGLRLEDCVCRAAEDLSPLPSNVDKVVLLGLDALKYHAHRHSLFRERGAPLIVQGRLAVATFHPQDADDFKSHEDEDSETFTNEKDVGPTQRSNWRFWIEADVKKILAGFRPPTDFRMMAYPNLGAVCDKLMAARDRTLFLDIECRRNDHKLNCVGIAIDNSSVAVVPFYRYNNQRAYDNLPKFLKSLAVAMSRNTVVIHNALFDLTVLCRFYRVLVGRRIYDTMLAHHRCFPEVEKSLGHAISYWTWLPFHKDTGVETPYNLDQEQQSWEYNARDVHGMREVYYAQKIFADRNPEYAASIRQANESIYPYLVMSLTGINVDNRRRLNRQVALLKWKKQFLRVIQILVGKKDFNPASVQQCVKFFHEELKYNVQGYTDGGKPSLDAQNLYKLRLTYDNPAIDLIIQYRLKAKALSMLDFEELPCSC